MEQGLTTDYSKYQRGTLLMAVFTAFLTTFIGSALNLSIPGIEAEFKTNAVTVGWVVTVYTMSAAAFSVPFGKLADLVGRKKILLGGVISFTVLSIICTMAASIYMLIIIRFLQGVSAACLFATNNAILISVYPDNRRGEMLGISVTATYIGLSVGPVAGGVLNSIFGWRSIFYVSGLIAVFAIYFAVNGAPPDVVSKEKQKTDILGNLLYVIMITVFLFGFSNIADGTAGKVLTAAGIVLLITFGIYENRIENPVIKISMFTKDIVFTLSNIAALLNYAATFAVTYLVSIYLQVVMNFPSQKAGLVLIAMPLTQALISTKSGKLSDTGAPYKLASMGMAFCVAGLGVFAMLDTATGLPFVITALLVMGVGFGFFSSPNTNSIMSRVQKADYAVANSIVSTMRNVGQSFSMALVSIIVSVKLGEKALSETTPEVLVGTIRICFILFLILCAAGTVISMTRGGKKSQK